jgi:hypothetical protein
MIHIFVRDFQLFRNDNTEVSLAFRLYMKCLSENDVVYGCVKLHDRNKSR